MMTRVIFLVVMIFTANCDAADVNTIDKRMYNRKNVDARVSPTNYYDDDSVCTTINYYNQAQEKKDEGLLDLINRVIIPISVGLFAILGFFLSLYTFNQQRKNRASDLHSADVSFWLKEVVFPTYIHPCIEKISKQQSLFEKVAERNYTNTEIDSILDAWNSACGEIKTLLSFGCNIPFFSESFLELHSKWNDLDDKFVTSLYPDEIANFIPESEQDTTVTPLTSTDKQMLIEFVSAIYTSISTVQKKKLN